ncbi:MAG: lysophospholipid acyltransferase family protein [Polyangiaceae bacterium]
MSEVGDQRDTAPERDPLWVKALTSLQVTGSMLFISAQTMVDAFRGKLTREASDQRLAWWSERVVRDAKVDLRVEGRENLDTRETFVIMSNHQSHFDVPLLFKAISPSMRMVAKTELFRVPIWGAAMHESGFIEVDRANHERAITSMKLAAEKIRSGIHVWIAPEGTRSKTGKLGNFKKGGFVLALDTATRILPVGVSGTRDILPVSTMLAHRGKTVAVVIGKPIDIEGKTRDELLAETRDAIAALMTRADELRSR